MDNPIDIPKSKGTPGEQYFRGKRPLHWSV